MLHSWTSRTCGMLTGLLAMGLAAESASAIATGNLVVVRVGDGAAALGTASTAVFLVEYTTGGAVVGSPIAMPIAVSAPNQPFTNTGTATSEGFLTQSSA